MTDSCIDTIGADLTENACEPVDHPALAFARLIQQYKNAPNATTVVDIYAQEFQELELEAVKLCDMWNIDKNEGVNLDVIGAFVGQERLGIVGALPMLTEAGDEIRLENCDVLVSQQEELRSLTDIEYRRLIKGRIFKNHSQGVFNEVIEAIRFIFDIPTTLVIEGLASFSIIIFGFLSTADTNILIQADIIPRPLGVGFEGAFIAPEEGAFGFEGEALSLGFADDDDGGGVFVERIF